MVDAAAKPRILDSFRCAFGFLHPNTRNVGRLLGPCYETGRYKPFWQSQLLPSDPAAVSGVAHSCALIRQRDLTLPPFLGKFRRVQTPARALRTLHQDFRRLGNTSAGHYSCIASFSTISSLLTLFSKFFSSFLRSTCMLSVSDKYLALGEVYLPLRAAFPSYPTLRLCS